MCYTLLLQTAILSLRHWFGTRTHGWQHWLARVAIDSGGEGAAGGGAAADAGAVTKSWKNRRCQVLLGDHWPWAPTCLGTAHVVTTGW